MTELDHNLEEQIERWHEELRAEFKRLRKLKIGCQWGVVDLPGPAIDARWLGKSPKFPSLEDHQVAILGSRDPAKRESNGFSTWRPVKIMIFISIYRDLAGLPRVNPTTVAELRQSLSSLWRIDAEAREEKPSLGQCKVRSWGYWRSGKCVPLIVDQSIFGTRIESFDKMLIHALHDLHVSKGTVRLPERHLVSLIQAARDLGFREAIISNHPTAEEEVRLKGHEALDNTSKSSPHSKDIAPELKKRLRLIMGKLPKRSDGKKPSWKTLDSGILEICATEAKSGARGLWRIEERESRQGTIVKMLRDRRDKERASSFVSLRTIRDWLKRYPEDF